MKKQYSNTAVAIASAFVLVACGGGGGDDAANTSAATTTIAPASASVSEASTTDSGATSATQDASTTSTQTSMTSAETSTSNAANTTVDQGQTSTATTFADCFEITPGIKFSMSNGNQSLGVQEQFEGQMAHSQMELRMDDTRFGGSYHVVTDGYIQLLGVNDYTQTGVFSSKSVYSAGAKLPASLSIGEKADISYTVTWISQSGSTSTENVSLGYTLVGFETMTLGGRNFENVCKVRITGAGTNSVMLWMAKGFGVIRSEQQDPQGATISGTRNELTAVTTMP